MIIDPKTWFFTHFPRGRSNSRGDRIRHACPFHDDNPSGGGSFVMFLPDGNFVCKADSCGKKGSFPLLYKEVENITWPEVYSRLQIVNPIKEEEIGVSLYGAAQREQIERVCPLPVYGLVPVSDQWPNYLTQRGYAPGSITPYGLFSATANEYRGCLVFPFWDADGNYRSFTARKMSFLKQEGRYIGPDGNTNDKYLYGAHVLRNMDELKRIVVVEGQFDVLRLYTYGEFAVGLSNKSATAEQFLKIKYLCDRHDCPAVVMLDGSAAKYTTALAASIGSVLRAFPAYLPEDKDPDSTPLEMVKEILDSSMMMS